MKAAFTIWRGRISPVFDVSRQVLILEIENGRVMGEEQERLPEGHPALKLDQLVERGVEALICGAVSGPVADMASAYGIHVIPFVAGEITNVKDAYLTGTLQGEKFYMPGCHRKRLGMRRGVRPGFPLMRSRRGRRKNDGNNTHSTR